jgi:hypothetical protein
MVKYSGLSMAIPITAFLFMKSTPMGTAVVRKSLGLVLVKMILEAALQKLHVRCIQG